MNEDNEGKLTFKNVLKDMQSQYSINHIGNSHVMALQRSDYVCIDENP